MGVKQKKDCKVKNNDGYRRYVLSRESDGSWSIADSHITQTERDHRLIVGLPEVHVRDLVEKLNAASKQLAPPKPQRTEKFP